MKKFKTCTCWGMAMLGLALLTFSACNEEELDSISLDIDPNKELLITSFDLDGALSVTIDEANKTISIVLECGTDVSALSPNIGVSSGASVTPASGTAVDLSVPVEYSVVGGNLFKTYRVSAEVQCVVGFLNTAPDVASIIDDDEKAAAEWFFNKFDSDVTRYISFDDIKSDPSVLDELKVLWWLLDGDSETLDFQMPDIALDPDVLGAITDWYKAGGNIYLYQYACRYIFEMGRHEEIPGLNSNLATGGGAGADNGDTWGTGIMPGLKPEQDMSNHPMFAGIEIDVRADDGMPWIKTMSPGWREDRNFMIGDMQVAYGLGDTDQEIYDRFTSENQLVWLGSWEWTGPNYFVVGMLEYLPNDDFQGRAIFQGQGGFEFNMNATGEGGADPADNPDGINLHQDNIHKLAENAINYLIVN